ncbi:Na(+)/H(+) antiporter subunit B [Acetohalobium arabaticum]|uniref:Putative multicomponent Na+:H+ antiporter subunit B n=1 Tax=Acetohalobium arabaticum (strain ATCC 49924 / DSM 5501 / Z-7288) TaxID=574087 RepID=D9QQ25_ACEAZ|nr:hydrogenase subunit MbhD domain-containing protein [Acetohalobium arabaticum]ADL12616.1 putative multicomponent Na+:H+ antiporter subunit B [Acetohalobium arabaticum DSM 5501]
MVNNITLLLLLLLAVSALIATQIKDLLAAIVVFGVYSLIMSIIWQQMKAPDLAITEAVVGIVISIMFVVLISRTERWEE